MTATLLLTSPNSLLPATAHPIFADTRTTFTRRVTHHIRRFADRKGISPRAVEYEIRWVKRGGRA